MPAKNFVLKKTARTQGMGNGREERRRRRIIECGYFLVKITAPACAKQKRPTSREERYPKSEHAASGKRQNNLKKDTINAGFETKGGGIDTRKTPKTDRSQPIGRGLERKGS